VASPQSPSSFPKYGCLPERQAAHFRPLSRSVEMCNKISFLVHNLKYKVNGEWAEQLGLEVTSRGDISNTAPFYETSVKGVYAVGRLLDADEECHNSCCVWDFVCGRSGDGVACGDGGRFGLRSWRMIFKRDRLVQKV
jgi:hypothetical protein